MFRRVRPIGFISPLQLTARQLTRLDEDHANGGDGVGGGAYAPSGPVWLNGAGLSVPSRANLSLEGRLQLRYRDASWCHRLDTTTLDGTAPMIDTGADEYHTVSPLGGLYDVGLNISQPGYRVPVRGERIRVVSLEGAGGVLVRLLNDATPTVILALPPSVDHRWAEAIFDGTNWRPSAHWTF